PFENIVATCANDNTVKLWKLPNDVSTIHEPMIDPIFNLSHDASVIRVFFHPLASNVLISCQQNKMINTIDVENEKIVNSFSKGNGIIDYASWNSDGSLLLVISFFIDSLCNIDNL